MTRCELSFVLADRISDFAATCAAAGFDGAGARRVAALYAGPACSERRVARAIAERLWLPVSLEPLLTGSRFGFDDEAPLGDGDPSLMARFPAGATALTLADRHAGACVAIVMNGDCVQQIIGELCAMLPDQVTVDAPADASVRTLRVALQPARSGANDWPEPDASPETEDSICAFLREHDAHRIEHPGGLLLDHLVRTARLLASWRARPVLVAAGLCHAAYGTAGFTRSFLRTDQRTLLAQHIGISAEAIVYAYGCSDRLPSSASLAPRLRDRFTGQTVPICVQLQRDLAELTCANELDVLHECGGLERVDRAAIVGSLAATRPLLSPRAANALSGALALG